MIAYRAISAHPALVIGAVVFVIAAVRSPILWAPQFIYEEAGAYWAMTFVQGPLEFLFDTWVGYLVVVPRAVFLVARAFPPELAPAMIRAVEAAIIAGVAAFFAAERFAAVLPDRRVRIAFATALGLLPSFAPYGSILHAQWILAAMVIGLALLPTRRWYDYPLAAIAILSGLPAALAAPAFLIRRPDRLTVLVMALAAVQIAVAATAGRAHPVDLPGLALAVGPGGWAFVALMALAAPAVPLRPGLGFAGLAAATLLAGAASTTVIENGTYDRFFVAYWIAGAFFGITAAFQKRPAGVLLVILIASGTISTVNSWEPVPNTDWAANAHCIGSASTCTVPIYPDHWIVHWSPNYEQPPLGGTRPR